MLNLGEKTILYIGGLFFIFLVAFIIYKFEFFNFFVMALIISGFFNTLWLKVISNFKNYTEEKHHIKQTEDRGTPYITYMASYTSILPLLAGGIYGLIAFIVILITFYLVFINIDIIYYNPLLAVVGYGYFKITTSSGNEMYVISKEHIKSDQDLVMFRITDYTYIVP